MKNLIKFQRYISIMTFAILVSQLRLSMVILMLCLIPRSRIQFQLLVKVASRCKILHSVPVPSEYPLCSQQSFDAHGPSCVNAPRTNAHLRPKAKSVAIGKSSAGIVEYTGTVNTTKELFSCIL